MKVKLLKKVRKEFGIYKYATKESVPICYRFKNGSVPQLPFFVVRYNDCFESFFDVKHRTKKDAIDWLVKKVVSTYGKYSTNKKHHPTKVWYND